MKGMDCRWFYGALRQVCLQDAHESRLRCLPERLSETGARARTGKDGVIKLFISDPKVHAISATFLG